MSQGGAPNPLLASVGTQGSLKNNDKGPNKGSGINISKREALGNLKSLGTQNQLPSQPQRGPPQQQQQSINQN